MHLIRRTNLRSVKWAVTNGTLNFIHRLLATCYWGLFHLLQGLYLIQHALLRLLTFWLANRNSLHLQIFSVKGLLLLGYGLVTGHLKVLGVIKEGGCVSETLASVWGIGSMGSTIVQLAGNRDDGLDLIWLRRELHSLQRLHVAPERRVGNLHSLVGQVDPVHLLMHVCRYLFILDHRALCLPSRPLAFQVRDANWPHVLLHQLLRLLAVSCGTSVLALHREGLFHRWMLALILGVHGLAIGLTVWSCFDCARTYTAFVLRRNELTWFLIAFHVSCSTNHCLTNRARAFLLFAKF